MICQVEELDCFHKLNYKNREFIFAIKNQLQFIGSLSKIRQVVRAYGLFEKDMFDEDEYLDVNIDGNIVTLIDDNYFLQVNPRDKKELKRIEEFYDFIMMNDGIPCNKKYIYSK